MNITEYYVATFELDQTKYKIIMYDGSAENKTWKKIYYEPIENMMFNNVVLIGIW